MIKKVLNELALVYMDDVLTLSYFEFHEKNYRNRLHFSSIIYTDFYPFNQRNIYRNPFYSKLPNFEILYLAYLFLRIRVNLTRS